jgi:CheY-like chemotaxis protein
MTLRVLIADDDPEMLDMVSSVVAKVYGAYIVRAATGHELLAAIADEGPYDFIVTDISMPWMTGLQVMHSARTAGLPVPVVVMTALRDPEIPAQVAALGDRARLIQKPFGYDDLVAALRAVVPPPDVLSEGARRD